ncbi:MAG: hypothetical protein ABEJ07_02585 [Candidatus Nanohaloarchaea archaeon]
MEETADGKYADRQVMNRLNGVSAHLTDLGLKKGDLDPTDIEPDFDVVISPGLQDYEQQEGADPYPVVDEIENSFLDSIKMDTDRGYFLFETEMGGTSEGWMPLLDEGKGEGIFCIEHPWEGTVKMAAYDGMDEIGEDFSGIEAMLETAYVTAREYVTDKGFRNVDNTVDDLVSGLGRFERTISRLEQDREDGGEEGEIRGGQHAGQLRGRDALKEFSRLMKRARQSNVIDYSLSTNFGDHSFERTFGGFKTLTQLPESAPYDTMEEAIRFRYPDSWIEKEQS